MDTLALWVNHLLPRPRRGFSEGDTEAKPRGECMEGLRKGCTLDGWDTVGWGRGRRAGEGQAGWGRGRGAGEGQVGWGRGRWAGPRDRSECWQGAGNATAGRGVSSSSLHGEDTGRPGSGEESGAGGLL